VGLPGVSVPMGFGPAGLPLGLHIMGDLLADKLVLRAGELFQQHTDWHERLPGNGASDIPSLGA
jgi:aspartyl-tRNA(Asn)/glutamyl-tRNA(Gln) amidotransferase subunit A